MGAYKTSDGADFRQRAAGAMLRLVNPLTRRLISAGISTGAPNILLTVPGRRSGRPRTVPVTVLEVDGRRFIQASYGAEGWAQNLRAAGGAATVTEGDRSSTINAVEIAPAQAAPVLQLALKPYRRSQLLRALMGPRYRPPVGVLQRVRIRVDDTLAEYEAEARRHPLFELKSANPASASNS